MIKSLAIFVATIFFSFAQNYDPNTGELIQNDVYDPLTGELKKENKAQIKKRVELKTGEVILGYLIDNNNDHAIIYSSTIDTIKIKKENINTITDFIDSSKINEQPRWVQESIKKPKNTQPQGLPSMEELKQAGEGIATAAIVLVWLMLEFYTVF
tara:strand:- start:902 stop:1366 length:465 start_codon:yes stop_codon:yes gene_type:complete